MNNTYYINSLILDVWLKWIQPAASMLGLK